MAEGKHTLRLSQPAPWKHVPWHIEEDGDAVRDANGHLVCTVAGSDIAKLIAAAPETAAERDRLKEINAELLEALKNLIESTYWMAFGLHGVAECSEEELYGAARAAIAKAERHNV